MTDSRALETVLRAAYSDVGEFSRLVVRSHPLRGYQLQPARAILESVRKGLGLQMAMMFSRQAGKDETVAQVIAYLLNLYQRRGGSVVMAAPTFRPQCQVSMRRLQDRLDNPLNRGRYHSAAGYAMQMGKASARFMSAGPASNARGETASLLLLCNEAQDVDQDRWDAVFDPMAASTNATTVFVGTAWTSRTLLARQIRHLTELEGRDGVKRVFKIDWEEVARDIPAYGDRVRARIDQLGRHHPFVKTEYFLEEIDSEGSLFPPARRVHMAGDHPRLRGPQPGRVYAITVDVAGPGEAEGEEMRSLRPEKDSTALTVLEIGSPEMPDGLPVYRVVDRVQWTGTEHTRLYASIVDLVRNVWHARRVVVDATGVGAGLAAFLSKALGERVVDAFTFNSASKSDLGWAFLGMCDTGRFKDHVPDGSPEQRLFWRQVEECAYDVLPGPGRRMRWGVPNPAVHDDFLISATLCARLDELDWRPRTAKGR